MLRASGFETELIFYLLEYLLRLYEYFKLSVTCFIFLFLLCCFGYKVDAKDLTYNKKESELLKRKTFTNYC